VVNFVFRGIFNNGILEERR